MTRDARICKSENDSSIPNNGGTLCHKKLDLLFLKGGTMHDSSAGWAQSGNQRAIHGPLHGNCRHQLSRE